jgi:transposase InsO family protein
MARDGVPVDPWLAALVARKAAGESFDVKAECAGLGVSRKTFYKYLRRFTEEGIAGLFPRSRRPLSNPRVVDLGVADAVALARKELLALDNGGWDAGADQIAYWLEDHPDRWDSQHHVVPSRATINRILDRRGLIEKVPQRRPQRSRRRFEAAAANTMWQMDGFEWRLADRSDGSRGPSVVVLQVSDDCSRFDLALRAVKSENAVDVWATVAAAIEEHGLPRLFLSDNGTAFSGRRRGWTSSLDANLTALGVKAITSTPNHPQTCGKNERAHGTAEKWLARQPRARDLVELQTQLDRYRRHYNHRRRKKHLNGLTPAQRYALGPKDGPGDTPLPITPTVTHGTVSASGCLGVNRTLFSVGRGYAGQPALLIRQDQHIAVFVGDQLVSQITLTGRRYQRRKPVIESPKSNDNVSPKS